MLPAVTMFNYATQTKIWIKAPKLLYTCLHSMAQHFGQSNTVFRCLLAQGHTKLISCFWSACGSIFSEVLDLHNRCNQYSACNHSVYTTCTQWLHHPSFHNCLHFAVLSPDLTLHDAFCCLYTFFFPLWFPKKKAWWPGHF